jgi:hypothetical protein
LVLLLFFRWFGGLGFAGGFGWGGGVGVFAGGHHAAAGDVIIRVFGFFGVFDELDRFGEGVVVTVVREGDAAGGLAIGEVAVFVDAAFEAGDGEFDVFADFLLIGVVVGELVEGAVEVVVPHDAELTNGGEDFSVLLFFIDPEDEAGAATDDDVFLEGLKMIGGAVFFVKHPDEVIFLSIEEEEELHGGLIPAAHDEFFIRAELELSGWGLGQFIEVEGDFFSAEFDGGGEFIRAGDDDAVGFGKVFGPLDLSLIIWAAGEFDELGVAEGEDTIFPAAGGEADVAIDFSAIDEELPVEVVFGRVDGDLLRELGKDGGEESVGVFEIE